MYLSVIVYVLFALLILAGGKFAGFNKFNEDFVSLEKTKALRGIAAVGVILHHISQQAAFKETKTLSFFEGAGIFFVAIFLFCSGYGLIKSLKTKENYFKGFVKNRIVKNILIPFLISTVIYALYLVFVAGKKMHPAQLVTGILGLTNLNDYGWFPVVLIVMYLAFYFGFRNNHSYVTGNLVVLGTIIVFSAIFCFNGHFAWWVKEGNWYLTPGGWAGAKWWMAPKTFLFSGEWWINTCIAFLMGLMFGEYEEKVIAWFKKLYWLKLFMFIVLFAGSFALQIVGFVKFGYWTEWSGTGPGILNKAITLVMQQPVVITFIILTFMIMMKFNSENSMTRFFGNSSLETYMMNYMAVLLPWTLIYQGATDKPLIVAGNSNLVIYTILVFAGSVGLGMLYKVICDSAKKLIK